MSKLRITITVDAALHEEASIAVAAGKADSISAWVGEAIEDRLARDRRLATLASLVADHEAEHGVITDEELAAQDELDRDAAARTREIAAGRVAPDEADSRMRTILDAGAFVALERDDRAMWRRLKSLLLSGSAPPLTHAGVVAQVWRGGSGRQTRLAKALQAIEVAPLDLELARLSGVLQARSAADTGSTSFAPERSIPDRPRRSRHRTPHCR